VVIVVMVSQWVVVRWQGCMRCERKDRNCRQKESQTEKEEREEMFYGCFWTNLEDHVRIDSRKAACHLLQVLLQRRNDALPITTTEQHSISRAITPPTAARSQTSSAKNKKPWEKAGQEKQSHTTLTPTLHFSNSSLRFSFSSRYCCSLSAL
jgi:hypothetical protein